MKLFQRLAIGLCVFVGFVSADDASYLETFQRYLEVSQANAVIDNMRNGTMLENMLQNIYEQFGDELTQDKKAQIVDAMKAIFSDMIDDMMPQMIAIHKQYFTESDLKEFIEFYESPIGRKLSQNMLSIQHDMQGMLMPLMMKYSPIIEQKLEAIMND